MSASEMPDCAFWSPEDPRWESVRAKPMVYAIEVWTVHSADDEEQAPTEMVECREFENQSHALYWAWARMEEGFFVRLFRR